MGDIVRFKKTGFLAIAALLILPIQGHTASFNCQSVGITTLEAFICVDNELSDMDSQVAQKYNNLHENYANDAVKREQALADQREFLRLRTVSCPIPATGYQEAGPIADGIWECLKGHYTLRLHALDAELEANAAAPVITDAKPEAYVAATVKNIPTPVTTDNSATTISPEQKEPATPHDVPPPKERTVDTAKTVDHTSDVSAPEATHSSLIAKTLDFLTDAGMENFYILIIALMTAAIAWNIGKSTLTKFRNKHTSTDVESGKDYTKPNILDFADSPDESGGKFTESENSKVHIPKDQYGNDLGKFRQWTQAHPLLTICGIFIFSMVIGDIFDGFQEKPYRTIGVSASANATLYKPLIDSMPKSNQLTINEIQGIWAEPNCSYPRSAITFGTNKFASLSTTMEGNSRLSGLDGLYESAGLHVKEGVKVAYDVYSYAEKNSSIIVTHETQNGSQAEFKFVKIGSKLAQIQKKHEKDGSTSIYDYFDGFGEVKSFNDDEYYSIPLMDKCTSDSEETKKFTAIAADLGKKQHFVLYHPDSQ